MSKVMGKLVTGSLVDGNQNPVSGAEIGFTGSGSITWMVLQPGMMDHFTYKVQLQRSQAHGRSKDTSMGTRNMPHPTVTKGLTELCR